MSPPDGSMKPPISRRIVVLPEPLGPSDGQELAVLDREVDRVEDFDATRRELTP